MTPFTDDDLSRLKKHLAGVAQVGTYPMEKLESLIARMEAAEEKGRYAQHQYLCDAMTPTTLEGCTCGYAQREIVWRVSMGK